MVRFNPPLFAFIVGEMILTTWFLLIGPIWGWAEINMEPWDLVLKDLDKGKQKGTPSWIHMQRAYDDCRHVAPHTRAITPSGVHAGHRTKDLIKCNDFTKHKMGAMPVQQIGKAASRFIQEDIKMDNVYDYMFHLLTAYSKLMKYKPTVPENATEIWSTRTMALHFRRDVRQLMDQFLCQKALQMLDTLHHAAFFELYS
ncbi:lipopolysaccharide-modifying protein [Tanacetum coccineum]